MAAVIAHLGLGADKARPIGDIAESIGKSRRYVEEALEELVQSVPVVSNHRGVYIAQTPQEARAYAQSLRGRIVAVQARISALERWADEQESGLVQTSWLEDAA